MDAEDLKRRPLVELRPEVAAQEVGKGVGTVLVAQELMEAVRRPARVLEELEIELEHLAHIIFILIHLPPVSLHQFDEFLGDLVFRSLQLPI